MTKKEFIDKINKLFEIKSKIRANNLIKEFSGFSGKKSRELASKYFIDTSNRLPGNMIYNEIKGSKPVIKTSKELPKKIHISMNSFIEVEELILNNSLILVSDYLSEEEFEDYCDSVATLSAYNKQILKLLHS